MGVGIEAGSPPRMPPKLDQGSPSGRLNIVLSEALLARLNEWRRRHPDMPNKSEAARILIEQALDSAEQCVSVRPVDGPNT